MTHPLATDSRYSRKLDRGAYKALLRLASQRIAVMLGLGLASLALQSAMAGPFPAEFELADLLVANGGDGSAGTAFNGNIHGDGLGNAVRAAGDVNGDGIDDFIMGAPAADPDGRNNAGQTYVVFGNDAGWSAEFELSSLLSANGGDGSAGFVLNGVDPDDRSGESISAAGDVNGDDIDDLMIGAPEADPANPTRGGTPPTRPDAGETYVVFGSDQGFPAEFELSTLLPVNGGDGSKGLVINGILSFDRSGSAVSNAGDLNDDGLDDIVIGAYQANEAYIVFGSDLGLGAELDLSTLRPANGGDGSKGFVFDGGSGGQFGRSVSAAGDMNGDGIGDLLVGASGESPGGRSSAGRCVVLFGSDQGFPAEMTLSSLLPANGGDGSTGFVLNGINANDDVCRTSGSAGDVNGDGFADIVIGAERVGFPGRESAGQSFIFFGTDQGFAAETELSSLLLVNGGDGSRGVVLNGIDEDDESGAAVSGAGDINGDGMDDVIVGAAYAAPGDRNSAGESYLIYGKPTGFPAEIELSVLQTANGGDGDLGFVLNGEDEGDRAGTSVSAAGDVNGDGIADMLIAALGGGPPGPLGQISVVLGQPDTDADGDGVGDTNDNCQLIANPGQCDSNGDGYGNHCDADLDNNGIVNSIDLTQMRSSYGLIGPNDADLDCNDIVNSFDLQMMRQGFGGPPGPSGLVH